MEYMSKEIDRMKVNFERQDFILSDEDMKEIKKKDTEKTSNIKYNKFR